MGQALYRKYRSQNLAEIVGQEHIVGTLTNALKNGRVSHAYLLTGPRGVGKTSIARILAHEINGLPYSDEAHLDIIEIDAASNNGVEDVRDLRDRIGTAPSLAKYKVFIIDEVHMLSKAAFNALLKTLEEPPAHVVFILATTEAHKLPETIISRTQRFNFRPVAKEQVIAHLKHIAQKEKITIDDAALQLIAEHGEGSFRDSISLLDQVSNVSDKVTAKDVEAMLGLAPTEMIAQLLAAMATRDSGGLISTLQELYAQGYEAAMVAAQLAGTIRGQLVGAGAAQGLDSASSLQLLRSLLDVPAARQPKQLLEIILLEHAVQPTAATAAAVTIAPAPVKPSLSEPEKERPKPAAAVTTPAAPTKPARETPPPESDQTTADTSTAAIEDPQPVPAAAPVVPTDIDVTELWQQFLDAIKRQYNTLYGILRMATPEFTDTQLTIKLNFAFHQRRVNEVKNRKIIADIIERLSGRALDITCVVEPRQAGAPTAKAPAATKAAPEAVSAINNIFGGAELLES